jgi:hypothetical protein
MPRSCPAVTLPLPPCALKVSSLEKTHAPSPQASVGARLHNRVHGLKLEVVSALLQGMLAPATMLQVSLKRVIQTP